MAILFRMVLVGRYFISAMVPLEREIKRGTLRHRHGAQPFYEWRLADFVLTTKHLSATTGSGVSHREILRLQLRKTSILPPRGEDGIELEVMTGGARTALL